MRGALLRLRSPLLRQLSQVVFRAVAVNSGISSLNNVSKPHLSKELTKSQGSKPKRPTEAGLVLMWVWLKINQEGLRRFWSMFPLTRATHFEIPVFYATAIGFFLFVSPRICHGF